MHNIDIHINKWLRPLSYLYGLGVNFRNFLFDKDILCHSRHFDIPIICIGNLTVGGTGKTPHTEYLIRLLKKDYHIAVLSRGYKRRTKDYLLATPQSTAEDIGDEPFQMMKKFPDIRVAVDNDRCHGIGRLMELQNPPVDVILLDDAFQHRYVTAGLNILLTSCSQPFYADELLPAGRLREPVTGKDRAQIVVVTKCSEYIKPIDFNVIGKGINILPYQQLFFSQLSYGTLYTMYKTERKKSISLSELAQDSQVLLLTGIANPKPLIDKLRDHVEEVIPLTFSDHHDFTAEDIKRINARFERMPHNNRMAITTEKDAARLRLHSSISEAVKKNLYIIPIRVNILQDKKESFNQIILDYVGKNQRNSSISAE